MTRTFVDAAPHGTIEVLRTASEPDIPVELVRFWQETGALDTTTAADRAQETVCVLTDGGVITGAAAVFAATVPLVGDRRFWLYRARLAKAASGAGPLLLRATFAALAEQFDPAEPGPIGLCVLLDDEQRRRLPADAVWDDPPMLYAGYAADGRQVRVGYFPEARISLA